MRSRLFLSGIIAMAGSGGLLVLGMGQAVPQSGAPAGAAPAGAVGYAGDQACAECHKKEFTEHRGGKHATTLRPADAANLGALMPPEGPIAGTPYAIFRQAGGFSFGLAGKPAAASRAALAFGSGKTGMTFATVGANDEQVEFRMSRIPSRRTWYITPGQEGRADIELGVFHSDDMTRRCIGCHSTGPVNPSQLAPKRFGVGCESCHGPGAEHVAAARVKGNRDLKIEFMSRWNARQINELCAKCHRSEKDVSLLTRDASSTQRFQPYGLMMSPCFKKSGERISCSTCHNSHSDVSHDQRAYERACLSCHQPGGPIRQVEGHGKTACPVNPRDKCIGCHMPSTHIFPGSKLPVKMADHMIWAYRRRP